MQSKDLRFATELDLELGIGAALAGVDIELDPIRDDVADLKVIGGLNPGDVNDTTVKSLLENPASETAASLSATIGEQIADPSSAAHAALSSSFVQQVQAPKDGVTSATAAVTAAIVAAAGRPLELPPGDYLLGGSIVSTVPVNLRLAPGARFLVSTNAPAIEFTGAGSGNSRGLYSEAKAGQNIVQCSTSGLAIGDWILLRHPDVFPGNTRGTKIGELHRVRDIDGAGQLRTFSNLDYTYPMTTSSVVKFSMLEGVKIVGGEFVNTIGAALKVPTIRLTACADIEIDTNIRGAGGPGITLSGCTLFDVRARVRQSIDDEAGGNFGYGVETFGVSCHGYVYVDMIGGRHAFTTTSGATTSGIPRHIVVDGIAEGTTNTAWDSHEEGDHIHFRNTTAVGCRNGAIKHRARNSTVTNPTVVNCLGLGVRFAPTAVGGLISGGTIESRYLSDGSAGIGISIEADDVTVTGDPQLSCDDWGIKVASSANRSDIRSANIRAGKRGNTASSVGIAYEGSTVGHRLSDNVTIDGALTPVSKAAGVTVFSRGRKRVDLDVLASETSQVGWSDVQQNSSYWLGARRLTSGAQNDEMVFVESLPFGAYKLALFHDTSTSRGIYEVATAPVVDGVIGTYTVAGSVDGYEGTSGRARSIVNVNVTAPGPTAIRFRMVSKHASATGYYGSISKATLTCT